MKKKKIQNNSGINVCDSIIMSVKRKHINLRRIEAVAIAVAGYVSTIMVFLTMFDFKFNHTAFTAAAIAFSALYIIISLMGRNAVWFIIISIAGGGAVLWRAIDSVSLGYKFVYNIIYKLSYHTEIEYYKFLNPELERNSVTTFFIFGAWVLAVVIYVFTIYHPHPLPPLIAMFPILEIGMYNGLKVSILWGMMVIAFLIAGFGMSTIDMGEYSGGNGGFVRKENLFFPKRQMKLKVTEKCGVYIIALVMIISGIAAAGIKITGYKRSDELNQKRIDIRDAVNSFSIENLADSISNITAAFGFTFKVETHKLGNISSMKYKDRTDMIVTLDKKFSGAIYLKEYTGSVYRNNEWLPLSDSAYNTPVFSDFETYGIYPQDFPFRFNKIFNPDDTEYTIWINSMLKGNRSFAPYGTDNVGGLVYNKDSDVSSKIRNKDEFSYKFSKIDAGAIGAGLVSPVRNAYSLENIQDESWKDTILGYCQNKGLVSYDNFLYIDSELPPNMELMYNNPPLIMTELLQEDYENFVYENYLQIPDDTNMAEVREEFAEILDTAQNAKTAADQIQLLTDMRNKVSSMVQYSLHPGKTPKNRDFVNYFLLENHKGYCTHYATSGVMLARMAGIPARYATGYVLVGDDFSDSNKNNDGSYTVDIKDNRSHAWVEVYLSGYGWTPFEFTAGYTDQTIDTSPATTTEAPIAEQTETTTAEDIQSRPSTTRNNSATTASGNDNIEKGTTAVTTQGTGLMGSDKSDRGIKISSSVKSVIFYAGLVIAAVVTVLFRRKLILYIRRKRFTSGSELMQAGYIYCYAEKLFEFLKINRKEMSYADFAKYVETNYGGKYFTPKKFENFMDISLRAAFADTPPSKEEMSESRLFIQDMAQNVYTKSSFLAKIYLKFISCLI